MEPIRAVKGMNDLFPDELALWQFIEKSAHDIFTNWGFGEIRTPILEDLSLFVRSVGEGTDLVDKEMYVLKDRDDSLLCMRPENTASVVRALIEHKTFAQESDLKLYYVGPMFRRERPQKGRLRQFHQIGAEIFGLKEPRADVELIALLHDFLSALGLKGLTLKINSLGEAQERKRYVEKLVAFYEGHKSELCEECQRRLYKNPLRLLDCKNPNCIALSQQAPVILDSLEPESKEHFEAVLEGLKQLEVPFEIAPRLVRGLDYYSRTVFELNAISGLGSQNAVAGGGRYDALIESLGGPQTPALGFALGIERIILMLLEQKVSVQKKTPALSFVCTDAKARALAFEMCTKLRRRGVFADMDHKDRSVKSQMRRADKMAAMNIVVLGEREMEEGVCQLKQLSTGETKALRLDVETLFEALQRT